MSQPNQPTQNYEIQSPTLETLVRTSLPSVAGYGGLLRSTNTIVPVFDVTATATGSSLSTDLQNALAFGNNTAFSVTNTTTDIITVPGFYRIIGTFTGRANSSTSSTQAFVQMTDGSTTKIVYGTEDADSATNGDYISTFDFIVFADTGITVQIKCGDTMRAVGSSRQVATGDGTLVDPSGFPV